MKQAVLVVFEVYPDDKSISKHQEYGELFF